VQNLAEVVTVVVERPSATSTPTPQVVTERPTNTPVPSLTASATPEPTATATFWPTPTPPPELEWAGLTPIATIRDVSVTTLRWSPAKGEFLIGNCWDFAARPFIALATAPEFSWVEVTPEDFICEPIPDMIWIPDGQSIIYNGTFPLDHPLHPSNYGYDNSALWIMDRDGIHSHPLNLDQAYGRWPQFIGWLDEQTLVYKYYAGGGHNAVRKFDMNTNEGISETIVHANNVYQVGVNYVAANNGMLVDLSTTAVAIVNTPIYTEPEFGEGRYGICLSNVCGAFPCRHTPCLEDNSRFEDWLPGTNIMLVTTWAFKSRLTVQGDYEKIDHTVVTTLQLWDVDGEKIEVLVENGIFGRFSHDGRYLAYHTLNPTTQLLILDMTSGEIILSLPSSEPLFKNDGQAFFWSPAGEQLLYQDPDKNWHLLQIPDGTFVSLTLAGGERISNPQWSYDGRYLSITVWGEGTAVLSIP
jgi:hypothetical protein